jgi:adenylate cyclase
MTAIADFKPMTAVHGIGVRQVRIACGLALFAYLVSHYACHALGNISYAAMAEGLTYHMAFWRNPVVTAAFYTAAAIHWALGLWALYERRQFRYTAAEVTQLVLGLSIPLLLAIHFFGVRMPTTLFGYVYNYTNPLHAYWTVRPWQHWLQFVLIIVAWVHGCIGLYYWLRLKRWFVRAQPYLLAFAVLLPALAIIGTEHGARTVAELMKNPQYRAANFIQPTPAQRALLDDLIWFYFPIGYGSALGFVFAARGVRSLREWRRGTIALSYPGGKTVHAPRGYSVLEASLRHNIPHASICGGRARCSTCRIRLLDDPSVPPPSQREAFVLERAGCGGNPAIRLACQLRPEKDVAFLLLLPPQLNLSFVREQKMRIGEERFLVSMFVDLRGSTGIAERGLPYDTVYLVNRFLAAVSQAVIDAGGQPNQFLGDGMLVLFGLDTPADKACRQAIDAVARISANIAQLNRDYASELAEPLRYGVGIHGGEVIVGDVGYRDHTVFTALGDAVNVTARLQDMTKTLDCVALVSEEVCTIAGIATGAMTACTVDIRGRDEGLRVRVVE